MATLEKCVWRRACRSLDSGLVSLASPSFLPARSPRCSPRRGREGWGCDFSWAAGLCFVLGVHRCPLLATPRGGRDWPHFSQEDTDSRWDVACPGLPCQAVAGLEAGAAWCQSCASPASSCLPWLLRPTTSVLMNQQFSGTWDLQSGGRGNPGKILLPEQNGESEGHTCMARDCRTSQH